MIFTEDEARTKHCPYCFNGKHAGATCSVSDCMAWRVYSITKESTGKDIVEVRPRDSDGNTHFLVPEMKEVVRGYCGLAGKPLIGRS